MIQRLRVLLLLLVPLTLSLFAPGCGGLRPASRDGTTDAMSIEGALANRYVRAGAATPVLARLRISTRTPAPVAKGPINVALVIDTSGSMEGQPIVDARAASLAMMDALSDDDRDEHSVHVHQRREAVRGQADVLARVAAHRAGHVHEDPAAVDEPELRDTAGSADAL